MPRPVVLGAVIYDPRVTVIWGIIRDFFEANGQPLDVVYYTNYERMVDGLARKHLDVAWNSPLAWLDAKHRLEGRARAIAMRDTDRDRVTHFVARKGAFKSLADLRGKTVALGAKDSPQATLIPADHFRRAGVEATFKRFDVMVGLHGDHVGGELDAFKCLERGEAQASAMLDLNWERWSKDGTVDAQKFAIVSTTDRFDHCNFTVRDEFEKPLEESFLRVLFSMSYDNPKHREMMDMEGLKKWEPGRVSGYAALESAVKAEKWFGA